jgi:hypothetical protein
MSSADPNDVGEAILRLALHDSDGDWVTNHALSLLRHSDSNVRVMAATALGHIARIHGRIDVDRVLPALRLLANDPATAGRAEDALDDIDMFVLPGKHQVE